MSLANAIRSGTGEDLEIEIEYVLRILSDK